MLPGTLRLTKPQARAFACQATGLTEPFGSLGEALEHLAYVQLDPLDVCGRMHDLILRNRVRGYAEGQLLSSVHQADRMGFEHFLPGAGILVVFPRDAWPLLQAHMQRRSRCAKSYSGRLSRQESALAEKVLDEFRVRGPLCSDAIDHEGSCITAWGTRGRLVKRVLDKLFMHGRVLITARQGMRRVYDLAERVLPPELLGRPAATEAEEARWLVLTKLRQRRLAALKKTELSLVEDLVQPLDVEGLSLYCLRGDTPLLENAKAPSQSCLLAPLDPLIYDRRVTAALWDFNYTWEVYTPAHKRVRGYYALPVLSKGELVGHVEPRAERRQGALTLLSKRLKRGHSVREALAALSAFLGLRKGI